jgi:hypothetical protein
MDDRFKHSGKITESGKTNYVYRVQQGGKAARWFVCFDVRGGACARSRSFKSWKEADAASDTDGDAPAAGPAEGGPGEGESADRLPALGWTRENASKCGRFRCEPAPGPGEPPWWLLTDLAVYEGGRPRAFRRASLAHCKRLAASLLAGQAVEA